MRDYTYTLIAIYDDQLTNETVTVDLKGSDDLEELIEDRDRIRPTLRDNVTLYIIVNNL